MPQATQFAANLQQFPIGQLQNMPPGISFWAASKNALQLTQQSAQDLAAAAQGWPPVNDVRWVWCARAIALCALANDLLMKGQVFLTEEGKVVEIWKFNFCDSVKEIAKQLSAVLGPPQGGASAVAIVESALRQALAGAEFANLPRIIPRESCGP